jgi:hypothetical protein
MSCLRYSANEIHAKNHRNEPSNNRYGYGINDTACDGGIISNSTFTNCRHGFTTATASIETNSQPELYGSTSNTTISNSKGRGCSNAAFDVHEEAFNVSFNNCESVGDYAGAVASGYGFQVRAQKIQLSNCTVQGSRGGFYIFMQYDGTTKDALLNNCKAFNVETSLQITAKDGLTMKDVIINGGFFESWGAVGNIFKNVEVLINGGATIVTSGYQGSTLLNSKVNIKDCYLESKSSNGAYRIMDLLQSSTLKLKNVELNVEESVATDGKLIRLSDSLSTVIGDNLDVITNGKTIFNVFDSSGSGIGKLKVTNVKADSDVLILTPTNFETVETSWLTLTKSSNAIFQDLASDGLSPNLGNAYDTTIYIRLKCLTANRVLGAIPVGKKLGQVLVIRNSASTFTLTVKHGTTYNTAIGADVTLPVDGAITLIWTGSQWVNTK